MREKRKEERESRVRDTGREDEKKKGSERMKGKEIEREK